jgi:hypothetical protein
MGTSHWTSNIHANSDYNSLTIGGFATVSATALKGDVTGDVTADLVTVNSGGRVALGADALILFGELDSEASILAVATALVATPVGLYIDTSTPALWFIQSDSVATTLAIN